MAKELPTNNLNKSHLYDTFVYKTFSAVLRVQVEAVPKLKLTKRTRAAEFVARIMYDLPLFADDMSKEYMLKVTDYNWVYLCLYRELCYELCYRKSFS